MIQSSSPACPPSPPASPSSARENQENGQSSKATEMSSFIHSVSMAILTQGGNEEVELKQWVQQGSNQLFGISSPGNLSKTKRKNIVREIKARTQSQESEAAQASPERSSHLPRRLDYQSTSSPGSSPNLLPICLASPAAGDSLPILTTTQETGGSEAVGCAAESPVGESSSAESAMAAVGTTSERVSKVAAPAVFAEEGMTPPRVPSPPLPASPLAEELGKESVSSPVSEAQSDPDLFSLPPGLTSPLQEVLAAHKAPEALSTFSRISASEAAAGTSYAQPASSMPKGPPHGYSKLRNSSRADSANSSPVRTTNVSLPNSPSDEARRSSLEESGRWAFPEAAVHQSPPNTPPLHQAKWRAIKVVSFLSGTTAAISSWFILFRPTLAWVSGATTLVGGLTSAVILTSGIAFVSLMVLVVAVLKLGESQQKPTNLCN